MDRHEVFMKRALTLAMKGKGRTSPNPCVGALIVKDGKIVGEGYHKRAGTDHAEVVAIKNARGRVRGATLYVTLEPCCHTDKLTPPCTEAIISAGIRQVVVAMKDPNPKVSGRGIRILRNHGIEVISGILKEEAYALNEDFAKYITTGIPFVILKIAETIDGKIATSKGESKWITGPEARHHVHVIRNQVDAIMVGIGTVIKDNPSLDCRIRGGRNPYRIIVDSKLRIPPDSKVLDHKDGKTIIATTNMASEKRMRLLRERGAIIIVTRPRQGMVSLKSLMRKLGEMQIMSVMIEGGSTLTGSALSERIVDKVMFFIAPRIMGGTDSIPSIGGKSPSSLRSVLNLRDVNIKRLGNDILVEAYI